MKRAFTTTNPAVAHLRTRWGLGVSLILLYAVGLDVAGAQETATDPAAPAPLGREYADFRIVTDRNIFDPSRTARSRDRRAEPEKPREPKIDVVALTGTLSYEKGSIAFFDSTASEFRKAAKIGDQIAGYLVKEIAQTQVALERESELLALKVGQQLRRQDEGAWEITTGAVISKNATTSGRSSRIAPSSARPAEGSPGLDSGEPAAEGVDSNEEEADDRSESGASPGEGPSEVLKRLLEQRRKEQAQ